MSDILIKNMDMPKEGDTYGLHLVIYPNGEVWIAYDEKPTTKAIELPPYGRLIDADICLETFKLYCQGCKKEIDCYSCWVSDTFDVVKGIPTVLEATKTDNKKKYSSGYPYPSETATSYSKTMEAST